jgi:hypothetical protein
MITLHEICHYIDWQDLKNDIPIILSPCDILIGERFDSYAAKTAQGFGMFGDEDHNKLFGAILFNLIRGQYPLEAGSKMQIAVSKTLIDDFTSECICEEDPGI